MTERPLSDQRHRERARTELGTSFAVEAAAGAGKTSELVARLLSLIRADKAPLDRIVAMTFTEKAAGELNMRVREELEKTLDGQLEAAERRHFSHALDDLGRAAICTIHSFCAGLLRERPAEAAVDPQFSVADEMTASVLRDRVWGDWLEAELAAGNPALLRAVAQGVNLDGRGNTILGLAEQLLDCRDLLDGRPKRPAAIPDTGKLRAELITEFDALLWHTQAHAAGDQAEKYKGELEVARRQLALSGLVSAPTSEATIASLGLRARPLGKQHWDAKPSSPMRCSASSTPAAEPWTPRGCSISRTSCS